MEDCANCGHPARWHNRNVRPILNQPLGCHICACTADRETIQGGQNG